MDVNPLPVLTDNYIWIFTDGETNVVVDPAEASPVLKFLEEQKLQLHYLINTHHHYDHIGGNLELKKETGCEIIGPQYDEHRIPGMDQKVQNGDFIELGKMQAEVLFLPGHTTGHIAYYFEHEKALFSGDTLFSLGCGRLFEGTAKQMWQSLSRIASLPQDTKVYCTHEYTYDNARFALSVDPDNLDLIEKMKWIEKTRNQDLPTVPTTIGEELKLNPFLRPQNKNIRNRLGLDSPKYSDDEVFAKLRELKDHFQ